MQIDPNIKSDGLHGTHYCYLDFDMSIDLPGLDLQFRITFLPNGQIVTVLKAIVPDDSGEVYRNAGGFGGVPDSGEVVAGLKQQEHDDDDHVVSRLGQAKRRRHGTGHESMTDSSGPSG